MPSSSPQDEEFIKRLRATFQVEAGEHLQAIAAGLLALEKAPPAPERASVIEEIYREAHSLKGAARAVDLSDVEAICQAMETVFARWKQQAAIPSSDALDILHKGLDAIRSLLDGSTNSPAEFSRSRDILLGQLSHLATSQGPIPVKGSKVGEPAGKVSGVAPLADSADAERAQTVRISIAKLDAQLLRAEDILPFKALTAQRARELRELTTVVEQWQMRWAKISTEARTFFQTAQSAETPGSSGEISDFFEWNADFHRSLEQKLRSLAAQADRDRHSVSKRLDELLEDSKKLLMLPFSTLAGVLPRVVREVARAQGKEAELFIQGGDIEIDKRILEEMKDPLIHMLRNSVDHGIEPPAERAGRLKPQRGTITIAVSRVNGSKVEILISDDGGGIDLDAVKAAAMRRGQLSPADAKTMTDKDAQALVFDSGISTSRAVTTLSGRGLGMAIVHSKVEKLGGQIALESSRGIGTRLRIVLPLTLATFRGILVTACDCTFVIPAANVERVLRIRSSDIGTVENREVLSVDNRVVALARLATVLDLPPATRARDAAAPLPVLILRASGERIAFVVDEVLYEEEVLVKPLRKPLVRVRNVGGATVLSSGKPVPTLNINDLVKSARRDQSPARPQPSAVPIASRILVVEDSITSRMLLKGILESAGYQVQVAVDGMDAYAQLREGAFDLVVSDVEMPRLNGLDLTARIRGDKRLADLPVILVTALESAAQRERGLDVGASAYIVKSSFDQSNLLKVVRRLL